MADLVGTSGKIRDLEPRLGASPDPVGSLGEAPLGVCLTLAIFGTSSVLPVMNAFTTELFPTELRGELKRRGFLTRDARAKERKKAGLKKARKRPQFSKR